MIPPRRKRLFRLDSLTLIRCPPLVRLNMTFPRAVILTRLASPLCDFCLGTFCLPSEPEFRAPEYSNRGQREQPPESGRQGF